ncbi:MAG: winged helix-turn-helix transcriptional regulator [Methanocella sp.]
MAGKDRFLIGIAATVLIIAAFVLAVVLIGNNAVSERQIPGIGIPDYVLTGGDDTVYLFSGDNVTALAGDGTLKYRFAVPDGYSFCDRWHIEEMPRHNLIQRGWIPIAAEDDGILYLYLKEEDSAARTGDAGSSSAFGDGRLTAVASDGRVLWNLTLKSLMVTLYEWSDGNATYSDAFLRAYNGRVYAFHGYNETVIDASGKVLWTVENVSDPGAVDEGGNLYLMNAREPYPDDLRPEFSPAAGGTYLSDYRVPASIVDSYDTDGNLRWRAFTVDKVLRQDIDIGYLPLYNNGTIYVPLQDKFMALDRNGSQKWVKELDPADYPFKSSYMENGKPVAGTAYSPEVTPAGDFQIYGRMPFDSADNLYVLDVNENPVWDDALPYLIVIGPDGSELSHKRINPQAYVAMSDGIGYTYGTPDGLPDDGNRGLGRPDASDLGDLGNQSLIAFDLMTGKQAWVRVLPVEQRTEITIDASNVRSLFPATQSEEIIRNNEAGGPFIIYNSSSVATRINSLSVRPGRDIIYVNYETSNYEDPVVFNRSRMVYAGGIYALDRNGSLLWQMTLSPGSQMIAAGNSTIVYSAGDGKIYLKFIGTAAGIAFLSALGALLHFFFAGTVARARGRLDDNENRNIVFRYIVDHPGSTLSEIARDTRSNLGTVRYHLLILGLNHRILAHRTGEKFVRYFTNAGSYDAEEQTVIAMLRRDGIGKVLRLIAERPGVSNVDIARALGIPESAAYRCIKEMCDKGLITRTPVERGYTYALVNKDLVERSVRKIDVILK